MLETIAIILVVSGFWSCYLVCHGRIHSCPLGHRGCGRLVRVIQGQA
jgi:hypothetical protein